MKFTFTRLCNLFIILTISFGSFSASSDPVYKKHELEELFTALSKTTQEPQAKHIESIIWSIWLTSEDEQVNAIMEKLSQARFKQDYETALEYSSQIIELKPDYAEGWNQRATMEFLLGNYDKSLADIIETLKREPRHFGALSGRAFILLKQNKTRQAIETINHALKIHPFLGLRHVIPNTQKSEVL